MYHKINLSSESMIFVFCRGMNFCFWPVSLKVCHSFLPFIFSISFKPIKTPNKRNPRLKTITRNAHFINKWANEVKCIIQKLFYTNMHVTIWFTKKHVKNKIKNPVSKHFLVFFKVGNWIHLRQKDKGTMKQARCLKFSWINFFLSQASV